LCAAVTGAVRALVPTLLAEIEYDELSRYIEGLGLKKARRITSIIADSVLERVKEEKMRLEVQVCCSALWCLAMCCG